MGKWIYSPIIISQYWGQMEEENKDEVKLEHQDNHSSLNQSSYSRNIDEIVGPASQNQSIEERVPSERIEEEEEVNDLQNHILRLTEKTQELHADEEFLKEELKVREQQTLDAYFSLMQKKKQLMKLVQQSFNKKSANVDISLTEELDELKKIINGQEMKIQQLKSEISKKGLAGVNNDESSIKIKNKADEIEKEIKVGRKFSSTQYVRDYLERPQAYKVSYEEAKYEYELRVRIKECLEQEKQLYEKKKEEINQAKKRERQLQQELHKEWDMLKR